MTPLEWFLLGLAAWLLLWGCYQHRLFQKEEKRSSHWRWTCVRACEVIMAERGGGTERAIRTAKDFCRYTPPDVVIESFLGDEAKEP